MPSKTVILVSCGARKMSVAAPAEDLYISDRFREARHYAVTYGIRWYVLSGKHGLLHPSEIVEPYDVNLNEMPEHEKALWARKVLERLSEVEQHEKRLTILASDDYSSALAPFITDYGFQVISPFASLPASYEHDLLRRVNSNPDRFSDHCHFYSLLNELQVLPNQMANFSEMLGKQVARRGVYFFFDENEYRRFELDPKLRAVRVGTHGVSNGSKASLWQRLRTHRGTDGGLGNHRSSIFRLHVGNAILSLKEELLESWGIGENALLDVRTNEEWLEKAVSEYLGNLRVAYLPIMDAASADSDRSYIEKNVIALLTQGGAIDLPSLNWLGNHSAMPTIRDSGLWNVNYVGDEYDPGFLAILEDLIVRCRDDKVTEDSLAPINWRRHMQLGHIGQKSLFE